MSLQVYWPVHTRGDPSDPWMSGWQQIWQADGRQVAGCHFLKTHRQSWQKLIYVIMKNTRLFQLDLYLIVRLSFLFPPHQSGFLWFSDLMTWSLCWIWETLGTRASPLFSGASESFWHCRPTREIHSRPVWFYQDLIKFSKEKWSIHRKERTRVQQKPDPKKIASLPCLCV